METHSIIANPQAQFGWLNVLETLYIAFTCTGESFQRSQNTHGGFAFDTAHVCTCRRGKDNSFHAKETISRGGLRGLYRTRPESPRVECLRQDSQ